MVLRKTERVGYGQPHLRGAEAAHRLAMARLQAARTNVTVMKPVRDPALLDSSFTDGYHDALMAHVAMKDVLARGVVTTGENFSISRGSMSQGDFSTAIKRQFGDKAVITEGRFTGQTSATEGWQIDAFKARVQAAHTVLSGVELNKDVLRVRTLASPELEGAIERFFGKPTRVEADGSLQTSTLIDQALKDVRTQLGSERPLQGQRIAVVLDNGFIPSEQREYAHVLRELGAQLDFVSDGVKTIESDLNGGTTIQQLQVSKTIDDVLKERQSYAGVIVSANYTSKNLSGGPLQDNKLFQLVDQTLASGNTALGLNCHALWALMGAKAQTRTPENYNGLNVTFNTVLEPEARALGLADARPGNVDLHHFATTDQAKHVVSSSAGVGTGTLKLAQQMALEIARIKGSSNAPVTAKEVWEGRLPERTTSTAGTASKPNIDPARITQPRVIVKAPPVDDPRKFDASLGADTDAAVARIRTATGKDKPLEGKNIAVSVETLFNATQLRQYAHVLGDLGANVVYTSKLWGNPTGTFESAVDSKSDKVHQLQVSVELSKVEAELDRYAAVVVPDGNYAKRLSYRPDGVSFDDNPLFKLVSAALKSAATKVAVAGRGVWGLLGADQITGGKLGPLSLQVDSEMRPEAFTAGWVAREGEASTGTSTDHFHGLISATGANTMNLIEDLAIQLSKEPTKG